MLRPVYASHANELWYKSILLKITRRLREVTKEILLPVVKQYAPQDVVTDAIPQSHSDAISAAFERMQAEFGEIDNQALRIASEAVRKSKNTVDDRLTASIKSSVGIDISSAFSDGREIQAAMSAALTANVDLITDIPAQYFDKLKTAVFENFSQGLRYEALADNILHIADVTDSRAKLIARDQTSKMNGAFNEVRQTGLGIEKYEWKTAGDERVRDEHADNDGEIFSWDDPPSTGHPGEDINCRCVAIPVFELDDTADQENPED
jgi:SPP1 gp7 family putative phage head morphogenesis protein